MNSLEILRNYVNLSNYQEPIDDLDFIGKFKFLSLPILSTICFFVVKFFGGDNLDLFEFLIAYMILFMLSSFLISQYYMLTIISNNKELFSDLGIEIQGLTLEEISDNIEDVLDEDFLTKEQNQ